MSDPYDDVLRSPHVVTKSHRVSVWRPFPEFARDYAVKRVLGKGSFAKAVLVANRKTGHLFTCKQLTTIEEEVSSEIDLLIAVSGETPFLCRYFDRFTITSDDNRTTTYCIMMEYVDGEDLQAYVKRHKGHVPATRRLLFNFLCSALDALSTLHAKFIAHRDVKPRNFIVTPSTSEDGTPHLTLIDLGLGVRLDERRAAPNDDAGTPAYFSPDMVHALYEDYINGSDSDNEKSSDNMSHVGNVSRGGDDEASGRVSREALYAGDLWALGASLHFLLTGNHIAPQYDWESPRLKEVFDAIIEFKLPKRKPGTRTILFHDDALIDRVVCSCLHADPAKRSTAADLLQLLKDEYEASDDEDEDDEEEDDADEESDDVEENDDENDDGDDEIAAEDEDERNVEDDERNGRAAKLRNGRRFAVRNEDVVDDGTEFSVRRNTRATRGVAASVILSPAPPSRERQRKASSLTRVPAAKKRVRAKDNDDARGYVVSPVTGPRRSKRSAVLLPTLTPRTLRQRNRRIVVDQDQDINGHVIDNDDADDEAGDDEDNEAQVSTIEAPPADEQEVTARRIRINERLQTRTRQQTSAAAAAAAAASSSRGQTVFSARRSARQRPAPAIDGTLSSDDHEQNPRSTSSMRTRAAARTKAKRR